MKIKLVDFNSFSIKERSTPFGLLSLSAGVEKLGHQVEIACIRNPSQVDELYGTGDINNLPAKRSSNSTVRKQFDLLGFSVRSDTLPLALHVAEKCKQLYDVPIILGGPGATFVDKDILAKFPFINVIVRGEGDYTFPELVTNIEKNQSYDNVLGITFRNFDGDIIRTPERPMIKDLDSLPRFPYHLIKDPMDISGEVLVGRGCPNNCTFCSTKSFWGRKSRVHSPKRIIEEIQFLKEEHGFTFFVLYHDNLLVHKRFIKEFCDLFSKNFAGLHFGIYGSVNFISEEIVQLLSSSGCYSIFLGLETTSQDMCKYIPKKHIPVSEIRKRLDILKKHGIKIVNSFIIGWPDETDNDLNSTLNFAIERQATKPLKIPQDVQIHLLAIFPGTELYKKYSHRLRFTDTPSDMLEHTIKEKYPSINKMCRENIRIFSAYATFRTKEEHLKMNQLCRFFRLASFIFPKTLYAMLKDCEIEPIQFFQSFVNHESIRDIDLLEIRPGPFFPLDSKAEQHILDHFIQIVKELYRNKKVSSKYSKLIWNYEEPIVQILSGRCKNINEYYNRETSDTDFLAYIPILPRTSILRSFNYNPELLFDEVYVQRKKRFNSFAEDIYFLYYYRRKNIHKKDRTIFTIWPLKKPISRIIPNLFPLLDGEKNCATIIENLAQVLGISKVTTIFKDNIKHCLGILLNNGVLMLKDEIS